MSEEREIRSKNIEREMNEKLGELAEEIIDIYETYGYVGVFLYDAKMYLESIKKRGKG